MKKISVITATLDRQDSLEIYLRSIEKSSVLPDEIIIIEQGNVDKTKETVLKVNSQIPTKVYFLESRSLTRARNAGIAHSKGEILLFFDDDITIASDYIEIALNILEKESGVLGLNGRDMLISPKQSFFLLKYVKRMIGSLFFLATFEEYNRVLLSGHNVLRHSTEIITEIEWMQGGDMVFKREVFTDGLSFNDQLLRWSAGEDVWLSYQVFKKYGNGSLLFVPGMKFKHYENQTNKISTKEKVRMQICYRYLFWRSELYNGKLFNLFAYLLSQTGLLLLLLMQSKSVGIFFDALKTHWFLVKKRKAITVGDCDVNQYVFKDD